MIKQKFVVNFVGFKVLEELILKFSPKNDPNKAPKGPPKEKPITPPNKLPQIDMIYSQSYNEFIFYI